MLRRTPEQAPVPEGGHGLGVAIEKLIADEVAVRVGDALEHSTKLDRLFAKPKPYTSFDQIPTPPKALKTPPVIESVVSQRDYLGRIMKMTTKPISGDGPTIETLITGRDELGHITRLVTTQVDSALPDPR